MEPPTAADWLQAWETGLGLKPALRALALLRAACPMVEPARLGRLPLGQRDGLLIDLREALFGRRLNSTATCPVCAERLEWTFETEQLRSPAHAPEALTLEHLGHRVRFRLPQGFDLADLDAEDDLDAARETLLRNCVLEAWHEGAAVAVDALPAEVVARLTDAMAAADPQAAFGIDLCCPNCGHGWEADFDIAGFLWTELDAWARRLLLDVHALATAYGWTERDVLALSPTRRKAYLELITS